MRHCTPALCALLLAAPLTAQQPAAVAADDSVPAAEFIEVSRLGQIRTRADNIRDIASGELKLTNVRYDSLAVRIYGDVAVLRGIADNTGVFRGFPFAGRIRYTRVFVRRDGRWQAVTMQQTPMSP